MSPLTPSTARRVFAASAIVGLVAALAAGLAGFRLQRSDAETAAPTPTAAARSAQAALELSGALGAAKAALADARIALTTDAFAVFRRASVTAEGVARMMAEAQDGGPPSPAAARAATALDAASNRVDARLATIDARDGGDEAFDAAFNRLRTAVQRLNAVEVVALFAAMQAAEARFALTPTPSNRQAFDRMASTMLAAVQTAPATAALRSETVDAVAAVSRLFAQNAALRIALSTLGAETDALIDQAATAVATTAQAASAGLDAAAAAPPPARALQDATPAFAAALLSFVLAAAAAAAAWSARDADAEDEDEEEEDDDELDEDGFDDDDVAAEAAEEDFAVAADAPIFPRRAPTVAPEPEPEPGVDRRISDEDAAALVAELNADEPDDDASLAPTPRFAPEPAGAIAPPAAGGPYAPVPLAAAPIQAARENSTPPAAQSSAADAPPLDSAFEAVIAQVLSDDPPRATPEAPSKTPLLKPKNAKPRTAADLAARALKRANPPKS